MKKIVLPLLLASLSATAAIPQPKQIVVRPVATSQSAPTTAVLSGLDATENYEQLPPVLVELENLPRGASVWVELKKGTSEGARRGVAVKSEFFLRQGGDAVLTIPTLESRCDSAGTWTVSVHMSDANGTSKLATATFSLRPGDSASVAVAN